MRVKLFVFDMEGTLFQRLPLPRMGTPDTHARGVWAQLVHRLGRGAVEKDAALALAWERSEVLSYMEWCNNSIRNMADYGLHRSIFENVLADYDYSDNVREVISTIHDLGVKTAIISGGFTEQARRAQADLHIAHAYTAVDLIWADDGRLKFWNIIPCDYLAKAHVFRLLMAEYGVVANECAFIGDGDNDVSLAKVAGISFAYQATEKLKEVATFSIENFSEIMDHID